MQEWERGALERRVPALGSGVGHPQAVGDRADGVSQGSAFSHLRFPQL